MPPETLFEVGRRTFDTPAFRGIECIEVEARSVINHVPGGGLPFDWTINPYRGCTHACTYCLAGDTEILMADGRTKPIAKLGAGDRVYGTRRVGTYRRYVTTEVVAHWTTTKRAYRVTLDDGTELIASADHRFLTDRGWKHVVGAEQGAGRRPFLTERNSLLGVGTFVPPPVEDEAYRRGYLTGMIRGDAAIGSYRYASAAGRTREKHGFRLALVDEEGLDRTERYLALEGIDVGRFRFTDASPSREPLDAIRTQRRDAVAAIRSLVAWPADPSTSWRKGFLAGVYDAEGHGPRDVIRISNGDDDMLRWIAESMWALGFDAVTEPPRHNGVRNVRVLGGLRERLAFVHTVDPAIARKRSIEGVALKSDAPLGVLAIEDLRIEMPMFDITTGTGDFIANGVVSHNCFARPTHTFLDMDAGRDFETKIVVKVNAPEVLRRQLAAPRWKGEHIAMGTGTDPYQRVEGRYELMRGIIGALIDARNPFSILTKSALILRDLDLLTRAADVASVSAAFSIGTLDDRVWRETEPGTPHPKARIDAVRTLTEAGIPTGVLMAPVLPGMSDGPEQLRAVVEAALEAGATHVSPILLHLRPGVREEFMPWLQEHHPDLVHRYERMYRDRPYGPKADREALSARTTAIVREARRRWPARVGSGISQGHRLRRGRPVEAVPPAQPTLW